MAKKTSKKSTAKKTEQKSAIAPNTVIKLTVPAKKAEEAYKKTLNSLKANVNAPGFRQGQVPSKIAEEQIGTEKIIERALQLVIPDLYYEAIKKEDKKPLSQPEFNPVSLKLGEDWIVEAHIAEKPSVKLTGYKKAVKTAIKDAEKHIEEQIQQAKEAAKKAAKESDKTPEPVKEPTPEQRKDHQLHHIYQTLIKAVGPDVPELLVKEEVRYELNNLVKKLEPMNITLEDFINRQGMTFEQLSGQMAAEALGRLQLTFVLDAIAEEEKIAIEDKEIEEQVDKIEDEKVREQQRKDAQYRALIEQTLKRRKVADYLTEL